MNVCECVHIPVEGYWDYLQFSTIINKAEDQAWWLSCYPSNLGGRDQKDQGSGQPGQRVSETPSRLISQV
jgi:hypothetical protein